MGLQAVLNARLRARVKAATSRGDEGKAVRLLRRAVRRWGFDWINGSRASYIGALDHLEWIVRHLAESEGRSNTERLLKCVAEMRSFFDHRENFRVDGRMMRREAALRWVVLDDRLKEARREFRECIRH